MIDKKALQDALTNALIGYQHRLDCPMPIPHETEEMIILKYRTDPSFHAKVKSLVSGVMRIVGEHLDGGHPMADKITAEQQPAPPETAPLELPEPFTTLVRKKSWSTNCYEASPLYNYRDYGRLWADERVNVYTEQQVRALLAGAKAKKKGNKQ